MKNNKTYVDILKAYYDEYDGEWVGYEKEGKVFSIEKECEVAYTIDITDEFMKTYKEFYIETELKGKTLTIEEFLSNTNNKVCTGNMVKALTSLLYSQLFDNYDGMYIENNKVFIGNREILKIEGLDFKEPMESGCDDILVKVTFKFKD